jgi:hypothetical protein
MSSRTSTGCFRSILIRGNLAAGLVIIRCLHGSAIFLLLNTAPGETRHHQRPHVSTF